MARAICPYCEREIQIEVKRAVKTAKPTSPGGLFGRLLGANRYEFPVRQEFDQVAAPAASYTPRHTTDTGRTLWDLISEILAGDRPDVETRRAPQIEDVTVPALGAVITGAIAGVSSLLAVIPCHWPWYVPFAVGAGGMGAFWFFSTRRLWNGTGLITHVERIVGVDLDGDGQIGNVPVPETQPALYPVRGELVGTRNRVFTEFRVRDPEAWHKFCVAVTNGANFSARQAKMCGVEPADFDEIVTNWASHDPQKALIDPSSVGERLRLRLTPLGEQMVRLFASTPPDAARG